MKPRFARTANGQLDDIPTDIGQRDPGGARRVRVRVGAVLGLLPSHPHIGALTAKPPRRRIVAAPCPYAITCRVAADAIVVLGIRHAARRPL